MEIEFNEMMEQTNIQYAIVGEMNTSLRGILGELTKTRTSSLAKAHDISGRSKMKQDELTKAVLEQITDPGRLESALFMLDTEEWTVFESLYANPFVQDNYYPYGYYRFLLDHGLVFTFFYQGKLYLVMPDEVKKTYAQLNAPVFEKNRSRRALVYEYILALTNLYGVYATDKLEEIFNGQNASQPLAAGELDDYLEHFLQREQKFVLNEDEDCLMDAGLVDHGGEDELQSLLQSIQGKPYYVPDKIELLKYADDGYFEMTPQLEALASYVVNQMHQEEEMVQYLIDDIQLACSMGQPLQELIYEFERRDLVFDNPKQAQQVIGLVVDVQNNTRLWSNCGHTPKELGNAMNLQGARPALALAGGNSPVKAEKIGRNDPCPCGSGLKYKKCCGK
ncbi:SEC-C motif-containing protein [Fontibacillus phaseoli]|uniref:SEC-C motif-containing protein n=1 Tax=Fontibacillus phaseoli TaxID=1416533 RepID=A0A369BGN6_9BACL|nr:SEC-C metal-binding domain-containing protein [Fontibacillus phaseoli]RCX20709.1 SEC-C motif-containing protein [Fontibacillus phaseoli]